MSRSEPRFGLGFGSEPTSARRVQVQGLRPSLRCRPRLGSESKSEARARAEAGSESASAAARAPISRERRWRGGPIEGEQRARPWGQGVAGSAAAALFARPVYFA